MGNPGNDNPQKVALWGLGEPEYLVAIIGLVIVIIGLIVVVLKGGDVKIFAAFTTVVGTIAGHALGGAGKRRADTRADKAVSDAERHASALRAVVSASDIDAAKRIASDALGVASSQAAS
jgi:hypothetical protein